MDSFSYGYRTIAVEDCCGDQDEGPHRDNLRDVGRRYADVLSMADVLAHFDQLTPAARRASFKSVLRHSGERARRCSGRRF